MLVRRTERADNGTAVRAVIGRVRNRRLCQLPDLYASATPHSLHSTVSAPSPAVDPGEPPINIRMMIIACPGSLNAGGMKTTTVAVLLFSAFSVFCRQEDACCFGRRIAVQTVRHAAAVLLMYLVLLLTGGILISSLEDMPVLTCFFEAASALGTVGLSLGITGELGMVSRVVLIILMYLGRVGGLTLIFAALSHAKGNIARLPEEKITVG